MKDLSNEPEHIRILWNMAVDHLTVLKNYLQEEYDEDVVYNSLLERMKYYKTVFEELGYTITKNVDNCPEEYNFYIIRNSEAAKILYCGKDKELL